MKTIEEYYKKANVNNVKKYGQFFTPEYIAKFMSEWVSKNSNNILDPAVGNSIFFRMLKNNKIQKTGFEIDKDIINFFNYDYNIIIDDYLLYDDNKKYDAIICNPPYNRFQAIDNRKEIKMFFLKNYNIKINGYTNQSILFLIKSINQLNENGKLAYILPTEFMESSYGIQIKKILLENKLIYAVINLDYDVFDNATTTSCIILLSKSNNDKIKFINVDSKADFNKINFNNSKEIKYNNISPKEKWMHYFKDNYYKYNNVVSFKKYAKISRGIATGCNNFFVLNKHEIEKRKLNINYFSKCISKSADIKKVAFKDNDFDELESHQKKVYLLNVNNLNNDIYLKKYIEDGIANKVNEKYLLKNRKPWYSMEQKKVSPIWITNANRGKIKVIRNLTNTLNLTTFHSCHINEKYSYLTNVIFCYLISNIGQSIIKQNKKTMGGGLEKYQPSDLNEAKVLNFEIINSNDLDNINRIYLNIINGNLNEETLNELDTLFFKYLEKDD